MSSPKTDLGSIADRLKEVRTESGLTQDEMAQSVGVKQQTWGGYERGKSKPSVDVLMSVSEGFDVSVDWILTGVSSLDTSIQKPGRVERSDRKQVDVPIYAARLGAGAAGAGEDRIVAYGTFWEEWLRNVAHIDPSRAFICEVRGRSMEDLLEDRDLVLGERLEVIDRQEDIYALQLNGHLYVKYVRDFNDYYELRSENDAFDPMEVTPEDSFRIIGRVVRRIVR